MGELAQAAACYAHPNKVKRLDMVGWPADWDLKWWKPSEKSDIDGRIKELSKSGAMIAAEIDRLLRMNRNLRKMETQELTERLNKQELEQRFDAIKFARKLFDHEICRYARGSVVYGTFEEGVSDRDWMVVVDDSCQDSLTEYPKHTYQESVGEDDYQFITENDFIEMIKNSSIEALECVFSSPEINDGKYLKIAEDNLDKWNLRKSISAICSNSWVKCKKKLTVEKDYNLRVAQKSLWHSLRLYMFGIQIATNGKINDFSIANPLWDEISGSKDTSWEYYKEKYQGLFNTLRSDLVKLCDRPKEDTK